MPPTNPTPEQLAARLNPTPVQIQTPNTQGLFKVQGDYGTTLWGTNAQGQYQAFDLLNFAKSQGVTGSAGEQADKALRILKDQYGIDYSKLNTYNDFSPSAIWQQDKNKIVSTDAGTDLSGFLTRMGTLSSQASTSTINNTPNALATPEQIAQQMKDPNWVGASTDPNRVVNQTTGQTAAQMTPQTIQKDLTSAIQGYGPSSYSGGSIVDYLGSLGKPSDFASRTALAKQFGIANYTGTADQNTQLLAKLRSLGSTPPPSTTGGGVTATGLSGSANQPIDTSGLKSTYTSGNTANAIVAGADATSKSIQDYINAYKGPDSDLQKRHDALVAQIEALLPSQGGRGAAQAQAEADAGVNALKSALADTNAQIGMKMAQYKALSTQEEGKPITMNSIIGVQAQIQKAMASDIGLLQAQALGLQGQLTAAQEAADRAVDLKFADAKDALDLRMSQLQLIDGELTKEEKVRADAINLYLQDRKDALNVQIANEKDRNATLLNLLQKYPDAGISINDSLETASAKVKNSRIYQQETRLANGDTPSSTGIYGTTPTKPTEPVPQYNPVAGGSRAGFSETDISPKGEWKFNWTTKQWESNISQQLPSINDKSLTTAQRNELSSAQTWMLGQSDFGPEDITKFNTDPNFRAWVILQSK